MTLEPSPTVDLLGHHFLALPRELRDLIYPYFVTESSPITLTDQHLPVKIKQPMIAAEELEAIYTHNTFVINFGDSVDEKKNITPLDTWNQHLKYMKHIRHLIINTTEVELCLDDCGDGDALERMEYFCTVRRPEVRKPWEYLLELPCLESLVINLQKKGFVIFSWANFSPILYQLRERFPRLRITFNVSFDNILRILWNDPRWVGNNPYAPMGFIDVSEMFAPPTEDDKKYVEEHLPEERWTASRNAAHGLLDETYAQRRLLGQYYVVKEPALLRVLMAEHYELYEKANKGIITYPPSSTKT